MNENQLFTGINTSFNKQQNPLRTFEFPCDKEYEQMNIGACSYFLLSEYPIDVKVYISLNPERKDAFLVDNRNTGFRINDVYSKEGIPSFVKDVYVWTEGITGLHDSDGSPKKVKIITSSIPSFEILNNSSINSIESIGQIGSINGLVGYPQGAITMCGIISPKSTPPVPTPYNYYGEKEEVVNLKDVINDNGDYIISCKAVLDPEMYQQVNATSRFAPYGLHAHAGIILPDTTTLDIPPNRMFSFMSRSMRYVCGYYAGGEQVVGGIGGQSDEASWQYSGAYIRRNFMDSEGNLKFKVELGQLGWATAAELTPSTTQSKLTYQIAAFRIR